MLSRMINPLWPLADLRREMDRMFDMFGPRLDLVRTGVFPALNVWEDGEALYAEAEIPGVKAEDLEVYTVGNELTIKGRRESAQGDGVSYHRRERGTGEFTRCVTLPAEVDADKVEARLENGVVTITMPKAEAAKPRKIMVKAG